MPVDHQKMTASQKKTVGVLKLNTQFPRLPGDIGNPASFHYPAIYNTLSRATPATVITGAPLDPQIKNEIIDSAKDLITRGASLITTSCGFLSPLQADLSKALDKPVITSSLELLPLLSNLFGSEKTGVITFDADKLNAHYLSACKPAAVEGLRSHDSLRITIQDDLLVLDQDQAESEVKDACIRLLQKAPKIQAIVLECTNLSPYKETLRVQFGRSVFDIVDAIHWLLDSQ